MELPDHRHTVDMAQTTKKSHESHTQRPTILRSTWGRQHLQSTTPDSVCNALGGSRGACACTWTLATYALDPKKRAPRRESCADMVPLENLFTNHASTPAMPAQ